MQPTAARATNGADCGFPLPFPMRDSIDSSARAPMRRVSILALVFVAAILSCGKDVTGPLGAAARYVRGLAFNPVFPPAFQVAGGSGVVQFNRVHVVLHHNDGTVALDTTIDFPVGQDSLTLDLTVKLLDNAPSTGEPMSLNLGYLNAAGDVVFSGGPVSVTAAPPSAPGVPNPPVQVPVIYTGPGATAVSVAVSPHSQSVNAGGTFAFSATAKDASGNAVTAPIIWNSLDPAIATVTSAAAGNGIAGLARGTARIQAQLFTGATDIATVTVLLPASQLIAQSGSAQSGVVGTTLASPLVVKVAAADGIGVAGTTVNFAVASGGGSVGSSSAVSDANGLAQTTFKLGTATGFQSVTATAGSLANSPVTFTDSAIAATATKLVVTTQPSSGLGGAALPTFAVTAQDNNGNIATTFTGAVSISIGANAAGGALSGTVTTNAVLGVATFSGAKINKNGTAYTLVASATGLSSATTGAFDIAVGPAATIALVSGDAQIANAGAPLPQPIAVKVTDLGGNGVAGTTVTFAPSSGTAAPPSAVTGVTGTASTTWTLGLVAGPQTMTVSAAGLSGSPVTIAATAASATGPAANLAITAGNGQTGTVSTALPTPLTVKVTDALGNPVAGTGVTFAVTGGGGSVATTLATTNAAGLATSVWTLGATVGAQTATATSAGLTGSPAAFTATGTIAVGGPAVSLTFTTSPSNAVAGVANSPSIVVQARDAGSLLATTFVGNVTLTIGTNPGASALSGGLTVAAVAGVATFPNVNLNHSGVGYTLVASSGVLTPGTSATFNITNAAAANFAITAGQAQTGTVSAPLPIPLTVKVTDAFGNAVAGQSIGFGSITGGGSLGTTVAVSDAAGQATSVWTLGATLGGQTVTATSAGLTGSPAVFTATGTASSVRTWNGSVSTAWTTAANWSPSGVPIPTDSVIIVPATNQPSISTVTTIKALTIQSGALLTFGCSTMTINGSLDATGGIAGCGGVVLGSPTAATVTGIVSTPIQMTGPYMAVGALAANSLQLQGGAVFDVNGNAIGIGAGGISTASTATLKMTSAGSAVVTTGGASFAGGSETGKLTAGTLSVASNFSEGGGAVDAYNAGTAFTTVLNGTVATNLSITDPATSSLGNLIINDAAGVTALTQFVTNNLTLTAGVLTSSLGASINGTFTDPLTHWAGGNISFGTSTNPISASTPTITPSAAITFNNNPTNLAANLTINGAVNVLGNLVMGGHTLTVNGAFATSTNGQLTMNNAADVVNVTGNVTFGSTGVGGPMSAGTMHIGGNFLQSGNSSSISTSGTNTVDFNGTAIQSVTFSSPDGNYAAGCSSAACFQNFTVNKATGQLNVLTDVKVQGNFTNSGSAPVVTPVNNGPLIIAGNAVYGSAATVHRTGVAGTFSKSGTTTIDSVSYFGAAQTYNPATLGEGYSDIRGTANWTAAGTLTGQMVLSGVGQLNVSNSAAVVTGNFTSNGTSTLKMTTNTTDTLFVGGIATFAGGATTGLLTTGNLIVSGTSINVTGLAIDASGTFTTIFNAASGTQTLNWTTPTANKGYNNLILRGAAQRQFSGNQTVAGNMLITATSGNVNGSYTLTFGGNITDQTLLQNAWNGSSSIVFVTAPSVLPKRFGVNNITFTTGTVTLADSLMGFGALTIDGATAHLKLNGHYLKATGNFTTQNGGVLEMTNANDSLVVNGTSTFNGGNTSTLLTHGYMNIASFAQGVNATAFVADSTLRTSIGQGSGTSITFANPGFGPTLSHFGELMMGDGSTHTVNSDVFVQGQITTAGGPQFPITSTNRLITAQGANATHLFLTNTRLLLVDGSKVQTLTDLEFLSMASTVTQFEVQRSGTANSGDFAATLSAPIFNTTPTSGLYLKATDTNGSAPFLTINVSSPTPLASGGFTSALSGAIISGWSSVVTVTSAATGNWSNPATWTPSVVPTGPNYNAVIASFNNVTVDVNSTVGNLTVNGSGTLTLPSLTTLTASGTLTNNGSTVCTNDNIVPAGSISLSGTWCGLRPSGTITLSGATTTGFLHIASGTVIVNGQTLAASTLLTSGTATLQMTNAADAVNISGNATFGGGNETGFLTTGLLDVKGDFAGGIGNQFNATNLHTIQFSGNAAQNIGWTTPSAGIGFNNVQFAHMHPRTFTSDVYIGGTVQIFSSDTGQFVNGAHRITLGGTNNGILDQAVSVSSGWQVGATNFAIAGTSITYLPNLANVDTTLFTGGGTVTLPFDQTMKNVVVDNTNLKLNGNTLNTQGFSFTTQNSGTLEMSTSTSDSLAAGFAYFNGGNTSAKLLGGGMTLTGLYQGYDPTFTPTGGSASAFSPAAGLHTYFPGAATVAFANPGTGSTASHFWYLHNTSTSAVVLKTNIFVDSLLMGDNSGGATYNSDAPSTTPRLITTKGIYNSGTDAIHLGGVQLQLNDGLAISVYANSLQYTGFPASFTGVLFTLNRSSAQPQLGFASYSAVSLGATGQFITNIGSLSITLGGGNSPATCNGVTVANGQSCK